MGWQRNNKKKAPVNGRKTKSQWKERVITDRLGRAKRRRVTKRGGRFKALCRNPERRERRLKRLSKENNLDVGARKGGSDEKSGLKRRKVRCRTRITE